jgi:type IV secretion system protein VirB9
MTVVLPTAEFFAPPALPDAASRARWPVSSPGVIPPKFSAQNPRKEESMQTTPIGRLSSVLIRALAVLIFGIATPLSHRMWAATEVARVVKYSKEDIVPVRAKLRFSTLIVLPEDEEILDYTTGDKDFWIVNGAHNLCYIHPALAGIRSNLNLITSTGHVYSFLLTEVSGDPNAEPDLKIFVELKEGSSATMSGLRGFVSAGELEAYQKELETLRRQSAEQLRTAQARAADEANRSRSDFATKLQFDFVLEPKAAREPFLVSAIFHDDTFTYIRSAAREKPSLYEFKDGKPNLINFQLDNGLYIAPKIIDSGYLAIGKKKLLFSRRTTPQ